MKIAVSHIPTDPDRALALARVAEAGGLHAFGIADSPHLFGAMYPVVQHVLDRTEELVVGPCVTNPVTRHPSVHAADLAALEALYPSRLMLAIGAGDSAVHSLGLAPAKARDVAGAVTAIRSRAGSAPRLWMAVSGPRAASAVPAAADGVVLGGGLSPSWLRRLADAAEASAGHRLEKWVFCVGHLVEDKAQVAAARTAVRASVMAVSRHALQGDLEARGVPPELAAGIEVLHRDYAFDAHARAAGSNADLLREHPEAEQYLMDRFAAAGTAAEVQERMRDLAASGVVDGVILSTTVPDPASHVRLIGEALVPIDVK